MKRQLKTGEIVDIHPWRMADRTDGIWGSWECEVEKADGSLVTYYLEGDGHLFHWETLKDEDGKPVLNYPPSDNFTPPVFGNELKILGMTLHQVVVLDENGIQIS